MKTVKYFKQNIMRDTMVLTMFLYMLFKKLTHDFRESFLFQSQKEELGITPLATGLLTWVVSSQSCGRAKHLPEEWGIRFFVFSENLLQALCPI